MTKVVLNVCFGGFSLSPQAQHMYLDLKGIKYREVKGRFGGNYLENLDGENLYLTVTYMDRTDPDLVKVVETLGVAAEGTHAELRVVDIAKGTRYRIKEYDGREHIEYADDIDWRIA